MSERLLITQALDERDLLVKKIGDKIKAANFVDMIKNNQEQSAGTRMTREDFEKQAKAMYQQITDLAERYQAIDAAIIESNAKTTIDVNGSKITVAAAISLRSRLREHSVCDNDFEGQMMNRMVNSLAGCLRSIADANSRVEATAENMRTSILGRDAKQKDDKPLEVVDSYVKENTSVLLDPLGVQDMIMKIGEKRDNILRDIDTKIKVSNATTYIEF